MPTNSKEYMRGYYRRTREELINFFGGKCTKCSENDGRKLFFHHLNGYRGKKAGFYSRGGWQQIADIKRLIKEEREEEIELRCREHHTNVFKK